MRTAIGLTLVAMLSACGGEESTPPAPADPCATATAVEVVGEQRVCAWECTTRDGVAVIFSWSIYDASGTETGRGDELGVCPG